MTTALLALLLLPAAPVERILLQARHAEHVKGDYDAACRLYRKAVEDGSLDEPRQAEIRLRVARCYAELGNDERALDWLAPAIYERPAIPAATRREAEGLRNRIIARAPREAVEKRPKEDIAQEKRQRVAELLAEARRHLARNRIMLAYAAAQKALDLLPDDPDAKALDAQLQTRLSGVAAVLDSPLDFLRAWRDAQVKSVAERARRRMHAALGAYRVKSYARGEREFREAIALIDGCEFADGSTELLDLRETIRERWRAERLRHHGRDAAEPDIEPRAAGSTPAADYLRQLQRMLDVLSSPEHEYRLLPVAPHARGAAPRSQHKPGGMVLERDAAPTSWTLARFADAHLRRRVEPESWLRRGNFLDTAGEMLVARNRPGVLDRLQAAIKELEKPATAAVPCDFFLVSVPTPVLDRFEKHFGAWETGGRGTDDPLLHRVVPGSISVERILGWLGEEGVEVRMESDRFSTVLTNARGETLLAGRPLRDAHGYDRVRHRGAPPLRRLYGVLLDVLPWRDGKGRDAVGLRVTVRQPAPPVNGVARFLQQTGELYADLGGGGTLVVTGLCDPFAAARAESGAGRSLLLIWRFGQAPRAPAAGETRGVEFEFVVRNLLYEVHADDPGPRRDPVRGFVATPRLDAIRERAAFLGERMRALLDGRRVDLDWEEAVVRVPERAMKKAQAAIDALERQATNHTFVVEVESYVVRTPAFRRWMERSGVELRAWDEAQRAVLPSDEANALLRQLPFVRDGDALAPKGRFAVLGLQARHLLATRTRTAPLHATDEALAKRPTQTVTEGMT